MKGKIDDCGVATSIALRQYRVVFLKQNLLLTKY